MRVFLGWFQRATKATRSLRWTFLMLLKGALIFSYSVGWVTFPSLLDVDKKYYNEEAGLNKKVNFS